MIKFLTYFMVVLTRMGCTNNVFNNAIVMKADSVHLDK